MPWVLAEKSHPGIEQFLLTFQISSTLPTSLALFCACRYGFQE
jgi:hypothetical protein